MRDMEKNSVPEQPGPVGTARLDNRLGQEKRGVDDLTVNVSDEHHVLLLTSCRQRGHSKMFQ